MVHCAYKQEGPYIDWSESHGGGESGQGSPFLQYLTKHCMDSKEEIAADCLEHVHEKHSFSWGTVSPVSYKCVHGS